MTIEFTNGRKGDVETSTVKQVRFQSVRGNKRYYVAIGTDMNAIEYQITRESYYRVLEAVDGGYRKTKNKA